MWWFIPSRNPFESWSDLHVPNTTCTLRLDTDILEVWRLSHSRHSDLVQEQLF
jgi:hypothetical protein